MGYRDCSPKFFFTAARNTLIDASTALVAQLVEHLICNQGVPGSNPGGGTIHFQWLSESLAALRLDGNPAGLCLSCLSRSGRRSTKLLPDRFSPSAFRLSAGFAFSFLW